MPSIFATAVDSSVIPITFVTKSTWETIRAKLPQQAAQFAMASDFSGKPGSCLALPAADGRIAEVLFGIEDESAKSIDPFRAGALPAPADTTNRPRGHRPDRRSFFKCLK